MVQTAHVLDLDQGTLFGKMNVSTSGQSMSSPWCVRHR
jgi:hypothetical protein